VRRASRLLVIVALSAASAFAQDAVVTRSGDGTVVVPTRDGAVTVTARTIVGTSERMPRRGVRLDEKQLDRYLRDRASRADEWT